MRSLMIALFCVAPCLAWAKGVMTTPVTIASTAATFHTSEVLTNQSSSTMLWVSSVAQSLDLATLFAVIAIASLGFFAFRKKSSV